MILNIEYTGGYTRSTDDKCHQWYCWMNNRRYTFWNKREGKAFYEFWKAIDAKTLTN